MFSVVVAVVFPINNRVSFEILPNGFVSEFKLKMLAHTTFVRSVVVVVVTVLVVGVVLSFVAAALSSSTDRTAPAQHTNSHTHYVQHRQRTAS